MNSSDNKVIIIGAGLAGSLLSIYLAKRGIGVTVFEARPDIRREKVAAGRSINLALSDRGIAALREVGMDAFMLSEAVPMHGRMIHSHSGEIKLLPYSGRQGEYINSVSRTGLNIALMNEAEKYAGVQFVFNEQCTEFDPLSGEVSFESGRTYRADTVIATDGAGSAVRDSFAKGLPGFDISQSFLEHGYKELQIPPGSTADLFRIEKNALHIWPRHQFMMIALPNIDGSFTCTLFLANRPDEDKQTSGPSFYSLTNATSVIEFFEREFPDAVPLMPTLVEDFFANPTGHLGTVRCWPWHMDGKALLLGDAAHAMVPFYGQGMNCAFEDVRVLDSLLSEAPTESPIDWQAIFERHCDLRKPDADAIQDLAEENFYEMRDATADPVFQRKRELETKLEQIYPDYFSKYSMVTFREDLPYSVAKEKGNTQDRLLMDVCSKVDNVNEIDLELTIDQIRQL